MQTFGRIVKELTILAQRMFVPNELDSGVGVVWGMAMMFWVGYVFNIQQYLSGGRNDVYEVKAYAQ
jgi:hypothetical protein